MPISHDDNTPGGGGGGDASAANQVIGNTSLSNIDSKLTGPWFSIAQVPGTRSRTFIAKATGGDLKGFVVNLKSTATQQFVQLHDAATATPVSTATLVFPLGPINQGDVKPYELEKFTFTNGIKLVLSSTEDTYTNPGTDDGAWFARFL